MSHEKGAYLGSIRSIADVRLRCVVDELGDGGCWHLRSARGRPMPKGSVHALWVYGRGKVSATKAVWELAHGYALPRDRKAVRTCDSYDCANPAHIRALSHSDAQRRMVGKWHEMTPARRATLDKIARKRRVFTFEQVVEIRRSNESIAALARKFGRSRCAIADIRYGRTYRDAVSSVWHWGMAA